MFKRQHVEALIGPSSYCRISDSFTVIIPRIACLSSVVNTGALAALAVAFSAHLGFFVPAVSQHIAIAGIAGIILVTGINVLGVKAGGIFSDLFTVLKIAGIALLVFTDWIFFALATFSVFPFRRRVPGAERPYRTLGYPMTPLFFVAISSLFVIYTLFEKPAEALAGLAFLILGVPVYHLWRKRNRPAAS